MTNNTTPEYLLMQSMDLLSRLGDEDTSEYEKMLSKNMAIVLAREIEKYLKGVIND